MGTNVSISTYPVLIAPSGIEMLLNQGRYALIGVLIAPSGIEIQAFRDFAVRIYRFNRTKWN